MDNIYVPNVCNECNDARVNLDNYVDEDGVDYHVATITCKCKKDYEEVEVRGPYFSGDEDILVEDVLSELNIKA